MPSVSLSVLGLPVPQGSMRPILPRNSRRPVLVHQNREGLAVWRAQVAEAARRAMGPRGPVEQGPVALTLTFALRPLRGRPKVLRTARQRLHYDTPWRRPDLSKLARAVEDALIGVVYADDAQIVRAVLTKQYGVPPGLHLRVDWAADA